MIIKINLDIELELSQEELQFLRSNYSKNLDRKYPLFLNLDKYNPKSLISKEVIKMDHISNCSLTIIGRKIMEDIDRDKRLEKLLN